MKSHNTPQTQHPDNKKFLYIDHQKEKKKRKQTHSRRVNRRERSSREWRRRRE